MMMQDTFQLVFAIHFVGRARLESSWASKKTQRWDRSLVMLSIDLPYVLHCSSLFVILSAMVDTLFTSHDIAAAFQYVLPPARQTSGHEPCRASRNRSLHFNCSLFIALGSLNAADGWVAPSPLRWVPRTRCKLAAFPQRHVLPFLLVVIGLSSPTMNLLPTLGVLLRTCRPLWAA